MKLSPPVLYNTLVGLGSTMEPIVQLNSAASRVPSRRPCRIDATGASASCMSIPTARRKSCESSAIGRRTLSPLIVEQVNDSLTPSLARTPSLPTVQPAPSRTERARSGSKGYWATFGL